MVSSTSHRGEEPEMTGVRRAGAGTIPPMGGYDPSASARERSVDDLLRDSDDFFLKRGPVHRTLRALAKRFDEEEIPYAILGDMALYLLGYARLTTDVDVLLTPAGLHRFRERFLGLGFTPAFSGAQKTFRDSQTKVKVEVKRWTSARSINMRCGAERPEASLSSISLSRRPARARMIRHESPRQYSTNRVRGSSVRFPPP